MRETPLIRGILRSFLALNDDLGTGIDPAGFSRNTPGQVKPAGSVAATKSFPNNHTFVNHILTGDDFDDILPGSVFA